MDTQTQKNVLRQIHDLNGKSMAELRKRWADLLGTDPGRFGRQYLIRRLAYRIQELAYGGLSRDARRELKAIADGATPKAVVEGRKRQKVNLAPGTRLLRDWRGDRYEVVVQQTGFLYNGKSYKSLTAVARAITASNRSGHLFFGLVKPTRGTT